VEHLWGSNTNTSTIHLDINNLALCQRLGRGALNVVEVDLLGTVENSVGHVVCRFVVVACIQ